ncbi:MAG TPA: hypothetical protein VME47_18375 [Acetobacteraceae bacterium]|nr:hypothetical protein [Acetobacteraceae bacterium]
MPTSSGRRKSGSRRAASGTRKRKRAAAARAWRGLNLAWDLLPFLLLLVFVLAVFVLDPAAVARLAWSSATGAFGPFVQVAVSTLLLAGAGAVAWAFWPEASPAQRRRKQGPATRGRSPRSKPDTAGAEPKPRTRKPRSPDINSADAAAPAESAGRDAPPGAATATPPVTRSPATSRITRSTPRAGATGHSAGLALQAGASLASTSLAGADQPG